MCCVLQVIGHVLSAASCKPCVMCAASPRAGGGGYVACGCRAHPSPRPQDHQHQCTNMQNQNCQNQNGAFSSELSELSELSGSGLWPWPSGRPPCHTMPMPIMPMSYVVMLMPQPPASAMMPVPVYGAWRPALRAPAPGGPDPGGEAPPGAGRIRHKRHTHTRTHTHTPGRMVPLTTWPIRDQQSGFDGGWKAWHKID
jgi:hypothetical protein